MTRSKYPADGCLRFQVLQTAFELTSPDTDLLSALKGLVPLSARHEVAPEKAKRLTATRRGSGFTVSANDGSGTQIADGHSLAHAVQRAIDKSCLNDMTDWGGMSSACVDIAGRRVLLVGGIRSGRSIAAVAFLVAGHPVPGDEAVLVRDGYAMPVARIGQIWDADIGLVDDQMRRTEQPKLFRPITGRRSAVAADSLGLAWEISPKPVDAVVFLEPDPVRLSRLTFIGMTETIQRLANAGDRRSLPPGQWISQICRLASAPSALLRFGDTVSAVAAVRHFMTLHHPVVESVAV